jgi:diguanylate cyclase (GGDEF)-like protein/PAS domain S-box-containing protein
LRSPFQESIMLTESEITQVESRLLELAPDAMLVVDQAGRISQINALAERLLGYPTSALVGQPVIGLIPARLRDSYQQHATEYLCHPRPWPMGTGPTIWGRRQDGGEFAAEISLNPLSAPDGIHVVIAVRDVSEYRRVQRVLDQTITELERQADLRNAELLQANAELHQQMAERAQAEAALRVTEALYRDLVESQPDLICRYRPDTTLTFVNAAYARFFGRPPAALLGQRFIEFLGAEEREAVREQLAAFIPAAPARQYEHKTIRADGDARWHLWHDFALFDDRGTLTGFQSVGVDITDRKRAEDALRVQEQRFRALIEKSTDAIALFDPEGTVLYASPATQAILGYEPAEVIDHIAFEFVHPDWQDPLRDRVAESLRNSKAQISACAQALHKDGSRRYLEGTLTNLLDDSAVGAIVVNFRDITERQRAEEALRKSEERFKLAMEATRDGLWDWNVETGETYYSPGYFMMLGYEPGEFAGRLDTWIDLLDPDDREQTLRANMDCIDNRCSSFEVEFRMRAKDGSWKWILGRGKSVAWNENGRATRMVGTHVDITERKRMEEALRLSVNQLSATLENTPNVAIQWYDEAGRVRYWNPASEAMYGWKSEEAIGKTLDKLLLTSAQAAEFLQIFEKIHATGKSFGPYETAIHRRDGSLGWVLATTFGMPMGEGRVGFVCMDVDITTRKQAEEALFEAKERAQVTLHSIGDAVITTDGHAVVDYLNPVAEMLTGWTATEAQGRPLNDVFRIVNEHTRQPAPDPVERCLREGKIVGLANHSVLIGRHGQEYHIDDTAAPIRGRDGRVLGAVLVFHDVTETRQLARQLQHDATHDALTGLINRAEFERRLERALASARQYGSRHALCYLDLDQFKIVNDTAGHAAGDELLRQINTILSGMFRERDSLARIGGDEFGLLLDNCPLDRAQYIAQAVVDNIRDHRFNWEGRGYQIGASIGLVPITAEAQDTVELLTQADVACYIAKELGRNRVHLYQREDTETVRRHGEILGAAGLRDALEQGRFRLHYQPIVSLNAPDSRPVRYEALLRVVYKGGPDENSELVLPAAFIPAAERYGLMGAIDRWVIQAAFREYAGGVGLTGAKIAINLSGNSLSDETLLGFIEAQFIAHAFPPEQVCFEITETAAIQNLRRAVDLMATLQRHGSQLALDDFGSGLSSFHYLKTLPIDYLKIDGSFVKDMNDNPNDRALVAAINQMSHTLGIQTIAEYAHSQAVVERLREVGVDYAQGYFFGQPVPWGEQP